ncbi:MAG: thiamine phosphate synthase [Eubacterium sp.]|jgi:Thiamine monophosphate synthase|nr:thiamine phosphate synthase [Eubacterium sp.]
MYRIAVTNRHLCREDFLARIRKLAEDPVYDAILLREKDLTEKEYRSLAGEVLTVCQETGKKCILHTFCQAAEECGHPLIHLPLPLFRTLGKEERGFFTEIGTSVHSLEEAEEAVRLGADYLTAGHIFPTGCKPDLPPRGLEFIKEICRKVSIPVYGIGGICRENEQFVMDQGACGVCMMSEAMR